MTVEFERPVEIANLRSDYERRFPMEMAILRVGGVYPGERTEGTINPYTGEVETEYFGNIGEHCLAVALGAEIIAENILGVDHPQKRTIVARALVHDATKGFEIMRNNAVRTGVVDDAYSPKAYETIRPLLEEKGIASDIVEYMVNAGSETGHISLASFVVINSKSQPTLRIERNLSEMIVHLADDMTHSTIAKAGEPSETYYLTASEKMEASDFPNRYPFIYVDGFGFDESGKPIQVKDVSKEYPGVSNVMTYAQWQIWVDSEIANCLVGLMGPKLDVEDPQKYLKQLVNNAIEQRSPIG